MQNTFMIVTTAYSYALFKVVSLTTPPMEFPLNVGATSLKMESTPHRGHFLFAFLLLLLPQLMLKTLPIPLTSSPKQPCYSISTLMDQLVLVSKNIMDDGDAAAAPLG
eukprot:SAG11_NODE_623_length_8115_cov_51.423278_8_plen_108_part_00